MPFSSPIRVVRSDTDTSGRVHGSMILSRSTYRRRTAGRIRSWKPHPCTVCTMCGTRASLAATRPTMPAFELCVWTMSNRPRPMCRRSSAVTRASFHGLTSRTSLGNTRTTIPRARASPRSDPSDPVWGPIQRCDSNRAGSTLETDAMVFSWAPPTMSRVMMWTTRALPSGRVPRRTPPYAALMTEPYSARRASQARPVFTSPRKRSGSSQISSTLRATSAGVAPSMKQSSSEAGSASAAPLVRLTSGTLPRASASRTESPRPSWSDRRRTMSVRSSSPATSSTAPTNRTVPVTPRLSASPRRRPSSGPSPTTRHSKAAGRTRSSSAAVSRKRSTRLTGWSRPTMASRTGLPGTNVSAGASANGTVGGLSTTSGSAPSRPRGDFASATASETAKTASARRSTNHSTSRPHQGRSSSTPCFVETMGARPRKPRNAATSAGRRCECTRSASSRAAMSAAFLQSAEAPPARHAGEMDRDAGEPEPLPDRPAVREAEDLEPVELARRPDDQGLDQPLRAAVLHVRGDHENRRPAVAGRPRRLIRAGQGASTDAPADPPTRRSSEDAGGPRRAAGRSRRAVRTTGGVRSGRPSHRRRRTRSAARPSPARAARTREADTPSPSQK